MISSDELVKKIEAYQTNFDKHAVIKAYNFSFNCHSSQIRSSGESYFSHPLAVAEILTTLKLDATSIITALLHDTVEDTDTTINLIEDLFGQEVATLVDGVTKLNKIEALSSNQSTVANFRKLVMAISKDMRVLLVKLADRMHNMQTIDFIKNKERRVRIASETLLVYAPLAARIGMYQIRDELQDLSFAQIHSESRNYIINKLSELHESKQDIINKIIHDLELKIIEENIPFKIYGREKKPYSIWNKMKRHNVGFDYLHDIMAFRVVTQNVADCYRMLGVINSNYNMIPGSFKDYISTPKDNGYRSLHLSTLGPQNRKIEVQIRTQEMHQIAEFGVAAHWIYKENPKSSKKEQNNEWLEELITLFENSDDYSEALRNNHIHIAQDQVFCFTPNGDVFNLPIGATILDFAYSIHSEIGNKCISAKVNGIIVSLRQKVENGDQVEITTDPESKPSPNWLQFVTTSKAKTAIKHFIRSERKNEYSVLGKAILYKFFASKNLEINDSILEKILKHFNKSTIEDLYVFVAEGLITRNDILKATYPSYIEEHNKTPAPDKTNKTSSNNYSLPIEGLITGMAIHFASCCHPIPGDEIVGIINTGTGVTIHNKFCYNLKTISLNTQKLLDVCWKSREKIGDKLYQSHIHIVMYNSSGSLASISNIIAKQNVNITNIKIIDREEKFFKLSINIGIKNTEHLEDLLRALRMSEKIIGVNKVDH